MELEKSPTVLQNRLILQNGTVEPEVNLIQILQIFNRRKFILLASIGIMVALAVFYSYRSTPIYEASALIKKEKTTTDRSGDELNKIFQLHTSDEVETEIEILKTRTVLEKVVKELDLYFSIDQITSPLGINQKNEIKLEEYRHRLNENPNKNLPRVQFMGFRSAKDFQGGDFFVEAAADGMLTLYDGDNDQLLPGIQSTAAPEFELPEFKFSMEWLQALPGSRIDFRVESLDKTIDQLEKNIVVQALLKTDLFKLTVQSASPYMAQLIANTLADKFRETRLEHKRETINYSLNFVNNQLKEISENLENTENELNNFRRKYQIINIDEVSKNIIDFLGSLEAEKVKTELQLAEYRNRYEDFGEEVQKKGYFDQTFLTPNMAESSTSPTSPFSVLLGQLSDAELKRLELLQKRTENHPDVKAVDRQIAEIKNKLSAYNRNTIKSYKIIMNSLEKKLENLKGLIEKYSQRERSLPGHETRLLELMRKKNAYEKKYTMLLDKKEEMRMAELSKLQDIVIVDRAHLPIKPVQPRKLLILILGLMFGIITGIAIILLKEFQDKTIQNLAEIEKKFQLPILAILPKYNKSLNSKINRKFVLGNHVDILRDPRLGFKESYRVMRTKLGKLLSNNNIVVITSCEEDTGKTSVLANTAVSLGLAGKKVLVIDCDLKKPKLGEFFFLTHKSPGLIDFLTSNMNMPPVYRPLENRVKQKIRLDIIPSGGIVDNSSELLDSLKLKDFLKDAASCYDYIFIDTPPVTQSVDSLVLGSIIKEVLLIIRPDMTHKDRLSWAIEDLKQLNIRILGCVVNGCDMKKLVSPYKEGYGYGYGYEYEYEYSYEYRRLSAKKKERSIMAN